MRQRKLEHLDTDWTGAAITSDGCGEDGAPSLLFLRKPLKGWKMSGAPSSENGAPMLLMVHQASLRRQFSRECDAKVPPFFQKAFVFFQKAFVFFQKAFVFEKRKLVHDSAPLVHHFFAMVHQPSF